MEYFTIREEMIEEEDKRDWLELDFDNKDRPGKLVFRYYSPTNHHAANLPDKDYFPERWRYYDFDLNAVREEVGKQITFSKNLSRTEFDQFEDFLFEHF